MHLCMEVMAKESLEGIRGRTTEVDPTGTATQEMSKDSSQESNSDYVAAPAPPPVVSQATASTPAAGSPSLAALAEQVRKLQAQMNELYGQPSALQRATDMRQLQFQEELIKIEKAKLDLQHQSLEVQRKMLSVVESLEGRALLSSMFQSES